MSSFDLNLRPMLAPHVRLKIDPLNGEAVLLFPEGLLILNETAHEIVRHCTGERSIVQILQSLAEEFEVDEEVLREDLFENLEQLRQKNLLRFST